MPKAFSTSSSLLVGLLLGAVSLLASMVVFSTHAQPIGGDPHPPIRIEGDLGFLDPRNGVRSGSGTPQDPYIISNWNISGLYDNLDDPAAITGLRAGIQILSTTKAVVIRDVTISTERVIPVIGNPPTSERFIELGIWLDTFSTISIDDAKITGPYSNAVIVATNGNELAVSNVQAGGLRLNSMDSAKVEHSSFSFGSILEGNQIDISDTEWRGPHNETTTLHVQDIGKVTLNFTKIEANGDTQRYILSVRAQEFTLSNSTLLMMGTPAPEAIGLLATGQNTRLTTVTISGAPTGLVTPSTTALVAFRLRIEGSTDIALHASDTHSIVLQDSTIQCTAGSAVQSGKLTKRLTITGTRFLDCENAIIAEAGIVELARIESTRIRASGLLANNVEEARISGWISLDQDRAEAQVSFRGFIGLQNVSAVILNDLDIHCTKAGCINIQSTSLLAGNITIRDLRPATGGLRLALQFLGSEFDGSGLWLTGSDLGVHVVARRANVTEFEVTAFSQAIAIEAETATIRNGAITNTPQGLALTASRSGSLIENVGVVSSLDLGIAAEGPGMMLVRNRVTDGSGTGIFLNGADAFVTENTLESPGKIGIELTPESSRATITNNTIHNAQVTGIAIGTTLDKPRGLDSPRQVVLQGNTVTAGRSGIELDAIETRLISNDVAAGCFELAVRPAGLNPQLETGPSWRIMALESHELAQWDECPAVDFPLSTRQALAPGPMGALLALLGFAVSRRQVAVSRTESYVVH